MPGKRCLKPAAIIAAVWVPAALEMAGILRPAVAQDCAMDSAATCVTVIVALWLILRPVLGDSARVGALYDALGAAYGHARRPAPPGVIPIGIISGP